MSDKNPSNDHPSKPVEAEAKPVDGAPKAKDDAAATAAAPAKPEPAKSTT